MNSKKIKREIVDDDVWGPIESFFKEYGLVHSQIEPFNELIMYTIPKIIENSPSVHSEGYTVEFGDIVFECPIHKEISEEVVDIYPKECIDRDITYLSHIFCNVILKSPYGEDKIYRNQHIGSIPVMVLSELCHLNSIIDDKAEMAKRGEDLFEQGGYFIINGALKVIADQQREAFNKTYVYQKRKSQPKFELYSEVRSSSINGAHSTTTQVGIKGNFISVIVPYIEMTSIPLCIMFRALGVLKEEDMISYICPNTDDKEFVNMLVPSLEQSYECYSQSSALHYIGKRGKKFMNSKEQDEDGDEKQTKTDAVSYARHLITTEFLPHLSYNGEEREISMMKKRFYLGYMVQKLINASLGRRGIEDRDHYSNKRIAEAGVLLAQTFHTAFKKLKSEISTAIEKCVDNNNPINISAIIKPSTIKTMMCSAISNNKWNGKGIIPGISQAYERFNFAAGLANARKFNTLMNAENNKIEAPRHVHNSHWGIVCPAETPEGKKCGLVTNSSVQCLVSTGSDPYDILELVENMNMIKFCEGDDKKDLLLLPKIFLNGDPIGVTKNPESIVNELKSLRRSGNINYEISIVYSQQEKEIHISTDAGRAIRPLFIVENGELRIKKEHIESIERGEWDDEFGSSWIKLLEGGYIEFLDTLESEQSLILLYPSDLNGMEASERLEYTHCELHPSLIFGIGAGLVPYSDHNQCIYENEVVFMADGTTKPIKDVEIGDYVLTFDPDTCKNSYTRICEVYSGKTEKKMYEISIGERKIKATFDHKFFTVEGWKTLEEIGEYDLIGISVGPDRASNTCIHKESIMDMNFIKTKFDCMHESWLLPEEKISLYRTELTDLGFIPLNNDNVNLCVIARILGNLIFSIDSFVIKKTKQYFDIDFETSTSLEQFINDCKYLGFNDIHKFRNKRAKCSGSLAIFFYFLCEKDLSWILGCSDLVKREFLSGFLGRYGGMITMSYGGYVRINERYYFFGNREEDKLKRVNICNLFGEFKIKMRIKMSKGLEGIGAFWIKNSRKNIIKIVNRIGYSYSSEKSINSFLISEFYSSHEESFSDFLDKVTYSDTKSILFIPYSSKIEIETLRISDITTESKNQSFVCGGRFCVHNSPRNAYQASMGKQAIGIPGINYLKQTKGTFHAMNYPQKPLVKTKISKLIGFDTLPAGQNAVVFVCPWKGFNQEDSIIINQDSIDRGFMLSTTFISYEAKVRPNKGEKFEVPNENNCSNFKGNSSKLDPITGIIGEGQKVKEGDFLIGKTSSVDIAQTIHKHGKQNASVLYDHPFPGKVHLVQTGVDGDGYNYVRVVVAQTRPPELGDKFCYHPDHEILTKEGWVSIKDVKTSDFVATLSKQGKIVYLNPLEVFNFQHDGELIEIESESVSLCVTPNHNLYVKQGNTFTFERAENITEDTVHKKSGIWKGITSVRLLSYLKFLGIYLVRGHISENKIFINIDSSLEKKLFLTALQELNVKIHSTKGTYIVIEHEKLLNRLKEDCGECLQIPIWVWPLDSIMCRILINYMTLGGDQIITISQKLKDDIMRLALHCGWAANSYVESWKDDKPFLISVKIIKNVEPLVKKEENKRVSYKGLVYCCTVPGGLLYTRRKYTKERGSEKAVWCGNSARHGQKGTVGVKYRSYDLPFTSEGVSPDILMNPLAFPSRMTMGMVIEMLTGRKVASSAMTNTPVKKAFRLDHEDQEDEYEEDFIYPYSDFKSDGDATPFDKSFSLERLCKELKSLGINEFCDEVMINGETGEQLEVLIFTGIAYYQRLKHMVIDKVHGRSKGGKSRLTRQPKEGRKHGGGQRVGYMERDGILAQGAPAIAKDRLMEQSDETRVWFCNLCGLQAIVIYEQGKNEPIKYCRVCETNDVSLVRMPYATKLLNQEFAGMNVITRVLTKPYE